MIARRQSVKDWTHDGLVQAGPEEQAPTKTRTRAGRSSASLVVARNLPKTTTTMASASPAPMGSTAIIDALGTTFKDANGASLPNERIAQMLLDNMHELARLAKDGKISDAQIRQVRVYDFHAHAVVHSVLIQVYASQLKDFADKHVKPGGSPTTAGSSKVSRRQDSCDHIRSTFKKTPAATSTVGTQPATMRYPSNSSNSGPLLSSSPSTSGQTFPISTSLNSTNPGVVSWGRTTDGRPTLTGGAAAGRVAGTWGYIMFVHGRDAHG